MRQIKRSSVSPSSRSASVGLCGAWVAAAAFLLFAPRAAQAQADPNALPPPPAYPSDPNGAQPVYPDPNYANPPAGQPYQPPPPPAYAPPPPSYGYGVPPSYRALRPTWRSQFGLGLRGMASWNVNNLVDFGQGGIGGELLFRAHPRLTLELAAQWQRNTDQSVVLLGYDRVDVPLTAGLRVHLGNPFWLVSPYLVGVVGADYARAYVDTSVGTLYERAWLFEGGGGGGLELRLGRHMAMNLDLRAIARLRSNKDARVQVQDALGQNVDVIGDQFSLQFNAGIAAYF